LADPLFDVAPPESEVFAYPEAGRTTVAVTPRVDGGERYVEVVGEFLGAEEPTTCTHVTCRFFPVSHDYSYIRVSISILA
jgi:hypothetical protein